MRNRALIAVLAVLCLGAFVAAQDNPRVLAGADSVAGEQSGSAILTGNVVLTIDGVTVRADRVVIQNGEATLEGNVRITLPTTYTVETMRNRVPAPPLPVRRYVPSTGPQLIDTPIPPAWQPPPRNQR